MKRRKGWLVLAALLILIGLFVGWVALRTRQARRDYALIAAIRSHNAIAARHRLDEGADPNAQDKGELPISFLTILRSLWHQEAHPSARPCALLLALEENQPEVARALLEHGANPRVRDPKGVPALVCALRNSLFDILPTLITHGANVNEKDPDSGEAALLTCAKREDVELVKLLVMRGADVHARDSEGRTTLHYMTDIEIVRLLLAHGSDVNAHDKEGITPLMDAGINLDCARLLLENGADPNSKDVFGCTPLHYAVMKEQAEMVQLLLERGADREAKNQYGTTARMFAEGIEEGAVRNRIIRLLEHVGAKL